VQLFSRQRLARARSQGGFGMIELLCAMTVMMVGILAVFGLLQSGLVQIQRASKKTTAAAIADSEMEKYRAVKYDVIGVDDSNVAGADSTYTSDSAYRADTTPATTLSSAITDTDLTLTVASSSGFPVTSPPFIIQVENERMIVNSVSTTDNRIWTIRALSERGIDYSTRVAHSAGVAVKLRQRAHAPSCASSSAPCTTTLPTKTVTGADHRRYRLDTYITWKLIQTGTPPPGQDQYTGRLTKLVTLVVREGTSPYRTWTRLSSSFDEGTGQ
jgi:Tfp pilus assembly protein PilV